MIGVIEDLFARCGGLYEERMEELLGCLCLVGPLKTVEEMTERTSRERVDDFGTARCEATDEARRHFAERFYSGCEADLMQILFDTGDDCDLHSSNIVPAEEKTTEEIRAALGPCDSCAAHPLTRKGCLTSAGVHTDLSR